MPVETAKCWRLLKIEPNAWAGGKGSCAVYVDLQREGSIFSNHQHFAVSTGICGVACPLLLYALAMAGWQRVKVVTRTTIKMASGVQDITCVIVEVAGSFEENFNLTVSWDGV